MALGGLNVLVNNAAYQMSRKGISDLSEYVLPCGLDIKLIFSLLGTSGCIRLIRIFMHISS